MNISAKNYAVKTKSFESKCKAGRPQLDKENTIRSKSQTKRSSSVMKIKPKVSAAKQLDSRADDVIRVPRLDLAALKKEVIK